MELLDDVPNRLGVQIRPTDLPRRPGHHLRHGQDVGCHQSFDRRLTDPAILRRGVQRENFPIRLRARATGNLDKCGGIEPWRADQQYLKRFNR